MKKLKLIILIILILFPCLVGCSDSKELDDQVYSLVIGVDKGVENKVRLTVQFPNYKGGGGGQKQDGGGGGGGKASENGELDSTIISTVEASSILEGINILNTATPRRISLVHSKAVIFSEDMAKNELGDYLQPLARFRDTRRIMQVVVCRGKAEDFIKENKTLIGESVAKGIELMFTQPDNSGYFPRGPFQSFYTNILSPYQQPYAAYAGVNEFNHLKEDDGGNVRPPLQPQYEVLPGDIPRRGDLKREFMGTAVFDGDKMVGSLNSYETRYFLMVRGEFKRGFITLEDKNKPYAVIPLDVRPARQPKIKARFVNGQPVIDVTLSMEADIGAIQSRIPYEKLSRIGELNSQLEDTIKTGVVKTIEKTQKDLNSDIFGFGLKIARSFSTIQEFEQYNWLAHYSEAKIDVKVHANVRRTGLIMGSMPIRSTKTNVTSEEK